MKKLIFLAFITLLPFAAFSQNTQSYRVTGAVTDSLSAPVVGVVVQLTNGAAAVAGTISGADGRFTMTNVPAGEFTLTTSHFTYRPVSMSCRVAGNTELPAIVLAENAQMIEVITVRPESITQQVDRYQVSLRNDPVAKGKTAQEVLDFLPAVSSREGELKIFGQGVSRVRINGVLIEDRKELAAIQAENIENVEVVYVSGVSDMAAGSGGEINIRLRRTPNGGFYGSVAGNTAYNLHYGNTLNGANSSFNYGYKKWSVYNYVGYNYNNQFLDQGYLTRYLKTGESNRQDDRTRGWDNYFSDRLSITYDIDPRHLVGVNLRYSRSKNAPEFQSDSRFTDNDGAETDRSRSQYDANLLNNQYQATLHYRWKLNDKGSEINVKADYLNYQTDNNKDYSNTYRIGKADESTRLMNNLVDNNVQMHYVDAKYTSPIGKGKFEAGLNYNSNRTRQVIGYSDLVGAAWVADNELSDDYRLRGDNYAAFASYSSKIGEKLNYQLGLRGERREMSYNSIKHALRNEKEYNVLDGQAQLMWMMNPQKGRMMTFSYARKTNAMPYSALSPVVNYLDEYTYSRGNVDLKPSTANMVTLGFLPNNDWSFNVSGLLATDMSYNQLFTDPDDPRVTYIMPVNAGRTLGIRMYAQYKFKVAKWWSASPNIMWQSMTFDTPEGHFTGDAWQFNLNNNFTWNSGWGGMLNLYCELPYKYFNMELLTEASVRGTVYKSMLKNKLRVNLEGVLFSHSRDRIEHSSELWRRFYNDKARYRIDVRLTWNFNGGKKVNVKQTSSSQSYNESLKTSKE